ncbi:TonB-dependent receptor [Ferruginibacter profundus]
MKVTLLILLLLPIIATAQDVKPVLSDAYQALISKDSLQVKKNKIADSSNSIDRSPLHFNSNNTWGNFWARDYRVHDIRIKKDNSITLQQLTDEGFYFGGTFSSVIAVRHSNQQPALQQQFAQGRSVNGQLSWQGPHTNELFSYGPALYTLEYDGTNYPYDINGQLVAAGTGNGKKSSISTPSIFRTAALFSNAITIRGIYRKNYQQLLNVTIKAGQSNDNSIIIHNKNNAANFSASAETFVKKFTLTGSYNYRQEIFSNNNRNGFLNRVYQQALLTPVSFDNRQGNILNTSQRSYSLYADNPFFLLENNSNHFLQQHYTGDFTIERYFKRNKIKLSQSIEKFQQHSNEGYQPGTAFFENGIAVNRNTHDANYFLNLYAQFPVNWRDYKFRGNFTANYIYSNNRSGIDYTPGFSAYSYQRTAHDASVTYTQNFLADYFESAITVADKIYSSNTAAQHNFFLPTVAFYARHNKVLGIDYLAAKIKGSFIRFNSELALNRSFAQNTSVQYAAVTAMQHLPLTEVNSFNNLSAIENKEYNTGIELSYKGRATLSVDYFTRQTNDDIFPVMNGNQLQLVNMADHRNQGIEVGLDLYSKYRSGSSLSFSNSFSFTTYQSKVTAVKAGYNFTPIAGFSDVNKAVVKGAPVGTIVGNSFLKDANNNIIIGADGFPVVNNIPSVIGDPTPDFTVKMTNTLNWKYFGLNIDWEWRKGGDIWNGTEALLDYYGRSATSAALRNTTNYIFKGVDVSGKPNTIPVSFYNPSLPVEQNRWVRYGPTGVAESYIQKGDCIRLNNISFSYKPKTKKYLQQLTFSLYASNIILWSAYKGADVNQLLNDQPGTSGLDFFNIPSYHTIGLSVSTKF